MEIIRKKSDRVTDVRYLNDIIRFRSVFCRMDGEMESAPLIWSRGEIHKAWI